MDLHLPTAHAYVLNPALDFEAAKQQAVDKRLTIVAGGLSGLFSRPKPEEVDLAYGEFRYEAFWHVVCTVRYVFERNKNYTVPVAGAEVRRVTVLGQEFEVTAPPAAQQSSAGGFLQQLGQQIGVSGTARQFTLPGVEHCIDENRQERFLDAVNNQSVVTGADYVTKDKTELTDLSGLGTGEAIVVAPQLTAAKIVKSLLATMIKQVQADRVLEESTTIEILDLYFRPVYAFELAWRPKNKTSIAEFDGVTGNMFAGKTVRTANAVLSPAALFDITADTATELIPTAAGNVKVM